MFIEEFGSLDCEAAAEESLAEDGRLSVVRCLTLWTLNSPRGLKHGAAAAQRCSEDSLSSCLLCSGVVDLTTVYTKLLSCVG